MYSLIRMKGALGCRMDISRTTLMFIILLLHYFSRTSSTTIPHSCHSDCECIHNNNVSSVSCAHPSEDTEFLKNIKTSTTDLRITGVLLSVPDDLHLLETLERLDLSFNSISSLPPSAFEGLSMITYLNLSYNTIEDISETAFNGLVSLKTLDLSHNDIAYLPPSVFHPLINLQRLDLKYNRVEMILRDMFQMITKIQAIDLSNNQLSLIQRQNFKELSYLKILNLRNNLITHLTDSLIEDLLQTEQIETDLSDNTFDCSCSLAQSLDKIRSMVPSFLERNLTCLYPSNLYGIPLKTLNSENLDCVYPSISYISPPQTVLRTKEVVLRCHATGRPKPGIVWITPWGQKFAHTSVFHDIGDEELYESSAVTKVYEDQKGPDPEITINRDGSLVIKNFRGFLKGNFSCMAISYYGNDTSDTYLNIHILLKDKIIFSLYIGAGSAGGFLLIGLLGAAIRHSLNFIAKAMSDHGSVYEKPKGDNKGDVDDITICDLDDYDDDTDNSGCSSPESISRDLHDESSSKCASPNDPEKWLPVHIIDTLDDMRWRLKYGVGRRVDKVRSHVQSIRSSGSLYVQSIRETSHVAVGRVRAGMVMGVEQMKYGMQSLKEFCGTGDLGQTISMISVSTDIDTNRQTEVIKSVTYV